MGIGRESGAGGTRQSLERERQRTREKGRREKEEREREKKGRKSCDVSLRTLFSFVFFLSFFVFFSGFVREPLGKKKGIRGGKRTALAK